MGAEKQATVEAAKYSVFPITVLHLEVPARNGASCAVCPCHWTKCARVIATFWAARLHSQAVTSLGTPQTLVYAFPLVGGASCLAGCCLRSQIFKGMFSFWSWLVISLPSEVSFVTPSRTHLPMMIELVQHMSVTKDSTSSYSKPSNFANILRRCWRRSH